MAKSKLTGDWGVAGRFFKEKISTFEKVGNEPLMMCANLYASRLKENIESQSLPMAELNPQYLRYKSTHGLDTRKLIATGEYLDSIGVQIISDTKSHKRAFVGVPNDAEHKSGIDLKYLAEIMEYGTFDGTIQSRPHYRPTWEQVSPECRAIWLSFARSYFRWR